jgi:putative endonuclease
MPTNRSALGIRGENQAVRHLESLGYQIIERNYRCPFGEIDIIALDKNDIVFVEVKTRRHLHSGYPAESVDHRKREKLILTAQHYLAEKSLFETSSRFDVVEVYYTQGQPPVVQLIRNAFWEEKQL